MQTVQTDQTVPNYAGMPTANRPSFTLKCTQCETLKRVHPAIMPSQTEIETRQKDHVCRTCKKIPAKVETVKTVAKVASATVKASTPKVAKVAATSGGKLRLADMFARGRIKNGDKLSIVGKPDSDAIAIDAKVVQLDGKDMPWNTYGQEITGHVAVNIYKHVLVNGVLLDTLRGE